GNLGGPAARLRGPSPDSRADGYRRLGDGHGTFSQWHPTHAGDGAADPRMGHGAKSQPGLGALQPAPVSVGRGGRFSPRSRVRTDATREISTAVHARGGARAVGRRAGTGREW